MSIAYSKDNLIDKIDELLPQTQCTRCGYPSCRDYATAIKDGKAGINQCPPGGDEGIKKLANLLNKPILPLNPQNGSIGPKTLAIIDEEACIGCTLCIKACPVDAIIGSNKMMHTIISSECTGCDLCIPVCPVDCIHTVYDKELDWNSERIAKAKLRFENRKLRVKLEKESRERRFNERSLVLQQENVSNSDGVKDGSSSDYNILSAILNKIEKTL